MVFFVVKVMPQEVANVLRPRHKLSEASNPLTLFLFESVEKRTTITSNPNDKFSHGNSLEVIQAMPTMCQNGESPSSENLFEPSVFVPPRQTCDFGNRCFCMVAIS